MNDEHFMAIRLPATPVAGHMDLSGGFYLVDSPGEPRRLIDIHSVSRLKTPGQTVIEYTILSPERKLKRGWTLDDATLATFWKVDLSANAQP